MEDLELFHFERLKKEVEAEFLKDHSPSGVDISLWKGIDIVYFQEDLRKKAKANLSEKFFYTYFKKTPVAKLPRIDMLNMLSRYVGHQSWNDFKKKHCSSDCVDFEKGKVGLRKAISLADSSPLEVGDVPGAVASPLRKYLLIAFSLLLLGGIFLSVFSDVVFSREYAFCFLDADRGKPIRNILEIKVEKDNESPITYRIQPGACFSYSTRDPVLKMTVKSAFYKPKLIHRNLRSAPKQEVIELKPDDYAIMLYYYSKSIKDLKKKREELEKLISGEALIYQVFDNEYYGVETMTKQKYISLVTLPSASLENLSVIETKMENGRIVMIKFKINEKDG